MKSVVGLFLIAAFAGSSFSCRNPDVVDLIRLSFFLNSNQNHVYNVHNFHEIFNHPSFDRNRNTVVYHYGWSQTPQIPSVIEVIQAYVNFGNVNFILVNYESVATHVSTNACTIGENIAAALIRLFDSGYEVSRVHLVGFSLGCTVLGITGREVMLQSNNRFMIERITGLDPGQTSPQMLPLTGRLGSGDARFVDTIHTDAIGFGEHEARGHVQYFVNGGVAQPHCTSGIGIVAQTCSHLFASEIWAESVQATSPIFPALQCTSWEHFLANNCNTAAPIGNLGVLTSTALRGSYFLRTNLVAPFSRAVPGP